MLPSIRLSAARRTLTVPLRPVQTPTLALPVQRRSYAAAPPKGAKPPITIHTLEGTYASALYSSTGGNNATLGDIEKALNAIRKRLDSDAKLAGAVVNPAVSHREKQDIVQLLSQIGGVGGEAGKAVKNLLLVMSENGRLGKWDGVQSAFERLMRAHKGEIDVVVTSAQTLDNRVLSRLEQSISKSSIIQKGQRVKMENKVNENILGGLIVEIGDRTIDLSVQSRVSKLNNLLYETL